MVEKTVTWGGPPSKLYAPEVKPAKPESRGRVVDISKIEQLPQAVIDAVMEGLSAEPVDFAIVGMGFLAGYEGMDIMGWLMAPFNKMVDQIMSILKGLPFSPLNVPESLVAPLASLPVQMGNIATDLFKAIGGGEFYPNKHVTAASKFPTQLGPGVSYYGPPPSGVDPKDWPPYGTTLSKLEDERQKRTLNNDAEGDLWKWNLEAILAEQKIKILSGCMGAILAYTITRPGVASAITGAVGQVISGALQGAGSAVPL